MDEKLIRFKSFFADQVKNEIGEQQKKNHSNISQLFKSGDLALGFVERVILELGYIVVKFPRMMAPRLKVLQSIVVIKATARQELGEHPTQWSCLWETFCENADYHSPSSDLMPMYYVTGDDTRYDYVACAGINTKLYDLFVSATSKGRSLPIFVYDPFPPVEYYKNLSRFVDLNQEEKELFIEPLISYDDWHPEELAFNSTNPDGIAQTIAHTLEEQNACIIQGPPGTGKSYTIATIVSSYLSAGKTVCVTTMANKGLVELIQQKPLRQHLENRKIYKTNLSVDERKSIKGVNNANKDLLITQGELLCATNYVLSGVYNENHSINGMFPHYDLIVIEEASQAFLTTIVAFKKLGDRCLIVGDPMQLPPIVNLNNPIYNVWNVNSQVEGLTTYALGTNIKSYRIITTFRLTERSARLTKLFYGNRFVSVKKDYLTFAEKENRFFPNEGGVLCYCTGDVRNGVYSESADRIIREVLNIIEFYYRDMKVAIITPYRHTVKELQKRFATSEMELELTIETVDRIQGMTVDYAIFYIPGRNPSFALETRRFNVATSRSQSTTLILSDYSIEQLGNFHSPSPIVLKFLSHCDVVTNDKVILYEGNDVVNTKDIKETEEEIISNSATEIFKIGQPKIGIKVVGQIDLSKFDRPRKEIKKDKENIYIVDTNVFVECPDILSRIDKQYRIVLSAKVVDELDTMKIKLDESSKRNAQDALRNINKIMQTRDIVMECADMSLLPSDFKRTPDNMILSVAMKFKDENPIMLTSDNGLQIKSKGLRITTISLKEFLKKKY